MTGVWALAGTYVRGHCLEAHFWLHWRMFGILSPSLCISFWIDIEGEGSSSLLKSCMISGSLQTVNLQERVTIFMWALWFHCHCEG